MTVSSHPRICLSPGCCPNKTHLEELPGFSAVIVKPASVSSAYRLRQRFNEIDAAGHDGKIVPLMGRFFC